MNYQVGVLSEQVISALHLPQTAGQPILLGSSNIEHMQSKHPCDYEKYGKYIPEIISTPDYVGQNPSDNSIEYVKEFRIDNNFVKVAVRVSSNGTLFARSLYILNHNRVINFINKGTLKKI